MIENSVLFLKKIEKEITNNGIINKYWNVNEVDFVKGYISFDNKFREKINMTLEISKDGFAFDKNVIGRVLLSDRYDLCGNVLNGEVFRDDAVEDRDNEDKMIGKIVNLLEKADEKTRGYLRTKNYKIDGDKSFCWCSDCVKKFNEFKKKKDFSRGR